MKIEDLLPYLIACMLVLVVAPVMAIYTGFVTSTLWGWFVSPLFGLPRLTVVQAIGLGLAR